MEAWRRALYEPIMILQPMESGPHLAFSTAAIILHNIEA